MTKQVDVLQSKDYIPVLDNGFCGLIDKMGTDAAIVQAARVSYGAGTKSVNEDRNLIRYLLRQQHFTPFEMCVLKFHIKCPIFVARQWFRHRTFSYNEVSYRYSLVEDDFYYPDGAVVQPQSSDNKQGRAGELSDQNKIGVNWVLNAAYEHSYSAYQTLIGEKVEDFYDLHTGDNPLFEEFPGIARELARTVLPVGVYTEFYCQVNLRNLFHFLGLRCDPHAQYEVRAFANAMATIVKEHFPIAYEAWEDYALYSRNMSKMDMQFIKDVIKTPSMLMPLDEKELAKKYKMSKRELSELLKDLTT